MGDRLILTILVALVCPLILPVVIEEEEMTLTEVTDESKCCCSCRHNKRTHHEGNVFCHCGKDGHYIGYIANFTQVCDEYKAEEDNGTD